MPICKGECNKSFKLFIVLGGSLSNDDTIPPE